MFYNFQSFSQFLPRKLKETLEIHKTSVKSSLTYFYVFKNCNWEYLEKWAVPPAWFLSLINFSLLLLRVYINIFSTILLKFNQISPKTYPPLERQNKGKFSTKRFSYKNLWESEKEEPDFSSN